MSQRTSSLKEKEARVVLMTVRRRWANFGGPALVIQHLIRANARFHEGRTKFVAVYSDGISSADSVIKSSPLGYFRSSHLPKMLVSALDNGFSAIGFLLNLARILSSSEGARTIFHAHDFLSAYIYSLFSRHPLVITIHSKGGWTRESLQAYPRLTGTWVEKVIRHVETACVKRASVVVFPSKGAYLLFQSSRPGLIPEEKLRIIYNGVDLKELDSIPDDRDLLQKYGIKRDLVVFAGGLVRDKGVDVLVEAIAALPSEILENITCVIIGSGILSEYLRSLIRKLNVTSSVKLVGFLERREVLLFMKQSKIFVIPSLVSVFDYALLEAASLGSLIITTPVGGNLEMFDSESAIFVKAGSKNELSNAIARILQDQKTRETIISKSRRRVRERFSEEAMLKSHLQLYSRIISRLGPP